MKLMNRKVHLDVPTFRWGRVENGSEPKDHKSESVEEAWGWRYKITYPKARGLDREEH